MSGGDRAVALVLVALAASACGRLGFDGGRDGAGGDGGGGDGIVVGPGEVGVTTGSRVPDAPPVAGLVVWSSHADGSLDDVAVSDPSGQAALAVDPGGAVSAAYPGTPYLVRTVFDVAPGDALVFGANDQRCDMTPRATVMVTWAPVNNAARYELGHGCDQVMVDAPATGHAWTVIAAVADPTDLVVYAKDADNDVLAIATKLSAPTNDGATISIGPSDWIDPPVVPIGITGIPAEFTMGDMVVLFQMPSSSNMARPDGVFSEPVTGGTVQLAAGRIPPGTSYVFASAAVVDPSFRMLSVARRFDAPFGASLLAPVGTPPRRLDAVGYDPSQRRIAWTTAADGETDAVHAQYSRIGTGGGYVMVWTGWAPGHRTELSIPALPDGVTIDQPAEDSGVSVRIVDLDASGWAELRQRPEWATPFDPAADEPHASSYVHAPLGPVP
jgi:hypothetical protein